MNIVLFGSPGVGKGTLANMLSKHFTIPHISSGDIIREEIRLKTEAGIISEPFVNKGELVPDNIIIDLMKRRLKEEDFKNGILFDGFPRTIPQAEYLNEAGIEIKKGIYFTASEKTIIERLSGRRICPKCRSIYHIKNIPPKKEGICDKCGSKLYRREDDKPEAIKKRLNIYEGYIKPLIDYYKKKGLIKEVNTEQPIPEIVKESLAVLK